VLLKIDPHETLTNYQSLVNDFISGYLISFNLHIIWTRHIFLMTLYLDAQLL